MDQPYVAIMSEIRPGEPRYSTSYIDLCAIDSRIDKYTGLLIRRFNTPPKHFASTVHTSLRHSSHDSAGDPLLSFFTLQLVLPVTRA